MTMTLPNPPQLWDDVDGPRARPTDGIPSHEGADKSGENKALVMALVLRLHQGAPDGLTDEELTRLYFHSASHVATHTDSPRKRRSDLAGPARQLIVDSGMKRPSKSGVRVTVWKLA
jgi:hypothetical protein